MTIGSGDRVRIDPATNSIAATIATQDSGGYVAFGGGAVWVTSRGKELGDGILTKIDPATNGVTASFTVGSWPRRLAYAGELPFVSCVNRSLADTCLHPGRHCKTSIHRFESDRRLHSSLKKRAPRGPFLAFHG